MLSTFLEGFSEPPCAVVQTPCAGVLFWELEPSVWTELKSHIEIHLIPPKDADCFLTQAKP